jgi:flagellar FliL protein
MTEQKSNKKRAWLKWVLIIVPILIIAGAAGIYYGIQASEKDNDGELPIKQIQTLRIPSFTINLADPGNRRYLRTEIILEFSSKELETEIQLKQHRIKDAVINILRDKKTADINNVNKSESVRNELINAINALLSEGEIFGLYFDEFIIQ